MYDLQDESEQPAQTGLERVLTHNPWMTFLLMCVCRCSAVIRLVKDRNDPEKSSVCATIRKPLEQSTHRHPFGDHSLRKNICTFCSASAPSLACRALYAGAFYGARLTSHSRGQHGCSRSRQSRCHCCRTCFTQRVSRQTHRQKAV